MFQIKFFFKEYGLYIVGNILFFMANPFLLLYFLKHTGSYSLAVMILAGIYFLLLSIFLAVKLRNSIFRNTFANTALLFVSFLVAIFSILRYDIYFIPLIVQWFFVIFTLLIFGLFIHKLALENKNIFWKALLWYVLFFMPIFFIVFLIINYAGIDYYEVAGGAPDGFFNLMTFIAGVLIVIISGMIFVTGSIIMRFFVSKVIFLQKYLVKSKMKKWQVGLIILICVFPTIISFLSFKELGNSYYTINGDIYALIKGQGVLNVERVKVENVDKDSFRFIGDVRARDKNHCYYKGVAVKREKEKQCYNGIR